MKSRREKSKEHINGNDDKCYSVSQSKNSNSLIEMIIDVAESSTFSVPSTSFNHLHDHRSNVVLDIDMKYEVKLLFN